MINSKTETVVMLHLIFHRPRKVTVVVLNKDSTAVCKGFREAHQ